jgi:hypothetical protein
MWQATNKFHAYKSGIFFDNTCKPGYNHALVVTGYGTSPEGIDYW